MQHEARNSGKSWIESRNPKQRQRIRNELTDDEQGALTYIWEAWVRPSQIAPDGDWAGWLIIAGRGWGKTRVGAEFVRREIESGRARRVGLVAETSADGRDVVVEGESGILNCCPPGNVPHYEPSKRRLTWPNGAIATLYDAREPDQLRGPQHDLIWFDELAKYRYAEAVFDQAMFGLRLGEHPRWIATTTPRPIKLIRRLIAEAGPAPSVALSGAIPDQVGDRLFPMNTGKESGGRKAGIVVTRGRSNENLVNIAPTFKTNVIDRYKGTRLGRQELDAEILDDVPGALWTRRGLDESRERSHPPLRRVVVAVDPAASSGEDANETGIIVGGIAANAAYVLEDWSLRGTPDQWARKAVAAWRKHEADCIVAEANQGGEMVRRVIQSVGDVPVKLVHATRGKYVRAEPISALYEQGRVHHVGTFPQLEDQMIAFTPDYAADRSFGAASPDRVDALVWCMTELFPDVITREPEPKRIERPDYSGGYGLW